MRVLGGLQGRECLTLVDGCLDVAALCAVWCEAEDALGLKAAQLLEALAELYEN